MNMTGEERSGLTQGEEESMIKKTIRSKAAIKDRGVIRPHTTSGQPNLTTPKF